MTHNSEKLPANKEQKEPPTKPKTIEEPVAKISGPEELQKSIAEKTERVNETQVSTVEARAKINEIRASLGLPATEEKPHSIQAGEERIEKLSEEKQQLENQLPQNEERKTEKSFTENAHEILKRYEITQPLNQLISELQNREEQHLTALVYPEHISDLWRATGSLETLANQPKTSLEEIQNGFLQSGQILEQMLQMPPVGQIRDNIESLQSVVHALSTIGEMNEELAGRFGALDESPQQQESYALRYILHQTTGVLDDKISQVRRLIDALEDHPRY